MIRSLVTGSFGHQPHEDDAKEQHRSRVYWKEAGIVAIPKIQIDNK